MRAMGLRGAVRGRACGHDARRTRRRRGRRISCERQFTATRPNQLWVADFTYVATWRGLRVRRLRHRRVRAPHRRLARLALAAHRLRARCAGAGDLHDRVQRRDELVHHSDRGTQYLSMRYTERLADAGIEPSVGSRGDSYDNALAESIIGLFKTEVIRRRGPWRALEAVEFATLEWVDWFNTGGCSSRIGYVPPAEYEAAYYQQQSQAMAA